jgi:hypothetical protein
MYPFGSLHFQRPLSFNSSAVRGLHACLSAGKIYGQALFACIMSSEAVENNEETIMGQED